ncbi:MULTISPECIES: hypothetical protein [Streptomyces]|uniref:DUF6907 domain-containing protein n=1 Tax=Streptomyces TaxID=1883 RepID=UPI00206A641E|nr:MULTISPECIES: hypothetical protein [Streptomyces]UPT41794.1 hypothetical protein MWG59_10340 [Streptomyces sp. WAC00303]WIY76027.1 hypothetical protein QPM16_10200 [Streptomyces anulatus]
MSTRIITVPTADHGDVQVTEPDWCTADHSWEPYRVDIAHAGAVTHLVITTDCHGPVRTLPVGFLWRPFDPTNNRIMAAIELDEWHDFDPAALARAADALTEHATTLRVYARQLGDLQAHGGEGQ